MEQKYMGKECPFCKTPFKDGEDIVVCDSCEMPHHRACWVENGGCTTFGCTGNVKTEGQPVQKDEQAVRADTGRKNQRMETLSERRELRYNGTDGVAVEGVVLFRDQQTGKLFVRCSLQNFSDKPIKAVMVEFRCSDVWGTVSGESIMQQYLDLQCKRGDVFGQTEPVEILDKTVRNVEVHVSRIMYVDGGVAVIAAENEKQLPPPETLETALGREDLAYEFRRRTSKKAKYAPIEGDGVWRCVCGTLCRAEETPCPICGSEKEALLSVLNDPKLEEGMLLYRAEQERKREEERIALEQRQKEAEERAREDRERMEAARLEEERRAKKEKRKKRTIRTMLIVIPLLIALVCGIIFVGIPYYRYYNACKALEQGEYDTAYATFVDLDGMFGSGEMAKTTQYQKADSLLEQKKFDEAKQIFLTLGTYKDADSKAKECDYQKAMALMEADEFDEAENLFLQLGDYSDSADMAKESVYRKGMSYMEAGAVEDYEQAVACFGEIKGYADSETQWKEASYQLAGLYAKQGNVSSCEKATRLYDTILGYRDSGAQMSGCISKWLKLLAKPSYSSTTSAKNRGKTLIDLMAESEKTAELVVVELALYLGDETYWFNTVSYDGMSYRSFNESMLYFVTAFTPQYKGSTEQHKLFRFLEKLASTMSNGSFYGDKIREMRSQLDTYFDYYPIQAFIKYYAKQVYLEGYWSGSGYYLHFYKDGDGGTYSQFDLPWVSKPSGTKYYQIRNMNYIWINEEGDELAKVFKFELISPDVIEVYCYKNGRTYTLYR